MHLGHTALTFSDDSINLKPTLEAAICPTSITRSLSNSSVLPHLMQIKW